MSHKSLSALVISALIVLCLPAMAQEQESERNFRLLRDSGASASDLEQEAEQELWVPGIKGGTVEVSFFLGFMDLKTTLLAHDQIIYKYNDEATYWGDIEIQGASAFNPGLRVGYNMNKWLSLEGITTISFSEYTTTCVNRQRRPNEFGSPVDDAEPELGEFDLEARSLVTGSVGANAVVYPLNIKGDGEGRFHPFLAGGLGMIWYDINSDYTKGASSSMDLNIGGGVRLLADRNISIRLEAMFHAHSIEFSPNEYFRELDEGTTLVPLDEFPIQGEGFDQRPVAAFGSNSISSLSYSIGVQGSF
jgi:hypothetical protein